MSVWTAENLKKLIHELGFQQDPSRRRFIRRELIAGGTYDELLEISYDFILTHPDQCGEQLLALMSRLQRERTPGAMPQSEINSLIREADRDRVEEVKKATGVDLHGRRPLTKKEADSFFNLPGPEISDEEAARRARTAQERLDGTDEIPEG